MDRSYSPIKLRMFGQGSTNVFTIGLGLSIFWIICRLYQKIFLILFCN
ncbi:hypothetical protein [Orientia tsutsugamushi]|nr:hypothetical protein [Orientia tsutsugamushi]